MLDVVGVGQRAAAEAAVLHDLVDALLYENLFAILDQGFTSTNPGETAPIPNFDLDHDEQYFRLPLGTDGRSLVFRVRQHVSQPYRLSRAPMLIIDPTKFDVAWKMASPSELLRMLAEWSQSTGLLELPNLDQCLRDLDDAVAQTALSFEGEAARTSVLTSANQPSLLDWEGLASLKDRPFHPMGRTKGGWSAHEYQRFSPEFRPEFGLDWVAVRHDQIEGDAASDGHAIARAILDGHCQELLAEAFCLHGLSPQEYLAMPVHPWQMAHVLPTVYADELARGVCVPLARGLGGFIPTTSLRSLSPADGGSVHVKVPLGMYSLGALRILPPRYLRNGARAQYLLNEVIAQESRLARRLYLCREDSWWAFVQPGGDPFGDKPGHLACQLREYPASLWNDPTVTLIPMSALAVVNRDGHAPAVNWILCERHGHGPVGTRPVNLFHEVCYELTRMALLSLRHGIMPELHGQNVLLVLRAGQVCGLLLRDHDTVRIHLPWLLQSGLRDPDYVVKPGSPNTLINHSPEELLTYFQTLAVQVNLQAIATAMARAFAIDEVDLWRVMRASIEACVAELELPSEVRTVLEQQLLAAEEWPAKLVLSPLLLRAGTGGGSMPSALGTTPNPLLSASDRRQPAARR